MKKLLSVLLIVVLCLGTISVSAVAANEEIIVSATGGTVKRGSTITVPISLDVNKGFATLGITVSYDADVLEMVCPNHIDGKNCSPSIEKKSFNASCGNSAFNSQYHTVNPYRIQWAYGTVTDNIYETGRIAAITFKVKNTAKYGETKVVVNVDQAATFTNVPRTVKGGEATVNVICVSHTYTNACDTECNTCSAVRTITHNYEWVIDQPNGCGKIGTKHEECTVCHLRRNDNTQIPATGKHTYTNACDTICNGCDYERTVLHSYEWVIDTPSTCVDTGIKHEECTICHVTKNEYTPIPASHTYDNACDTDCNICGATRAITHSYKTSTTPATTANDGLVVSKCSICGKVSSQRTIRRVKSVALSSTSTIYNGKRRTPAIVVKDYDGNTISSEHYRVSYATGRINVGRYKVVVALKGDYSGRSDFYFSILPPKTTVSKLTPGSKKMTVDITKQTTQVTGYQIQYCTNTGFIGYQYKTIRSNTSVKHTLTGLKAKKRYYVRVRTYKTVSGKHYYSPWSAYKYATTK